MVMVIKRLKNGKCDGLGLFFEHLKHACPAIVNDLLLFLTLCFRHGYLPKCIRDCVIVSVPKPGKDASCSQNYRPITLASTLSKVLEHIILLQHQHIFQSNHLRFGFKAKSSTTLCTALMKMVISRYINSGSNVFGCYLDASKAFDKVDHYLLFQKLERRGVPPAILNFLLSLYSTQQMKIQWDSKSTSKCFYVSNGVCQGGVLSPFLFAIYLDDLLSELSLSGVGCYWRWWFADVFCFADDIVLLGPCASALRTMVTICTSFALSHCLLFNTENTQLILLSRNAINLPNDIIEFN